MGGRGRLLVGRVGYTDGAKFTTEEEIGINNTLYALVDFSLYSRIHLGSYKILRADFIVLYILEESQTPVITASALLALSSMFTHCSTFNKSPCFSTYCATSC